MTYPANPLDAADFLLAAAERDEKFGPALDDIHDAVDRLLSVATRDASAASITNALRTGRRALAAYEAA